MDHLAKGLLSILRRLTKQRIAGSRLKYTLIAIVGLLRVRGTRSHPPVSGHLTGWAHLAEAASGGLA
jgi:hypothetical protein